MTQMNKFGLIMAVALLVCLLPMPYGYFILVRFVAMVYFGLLALKYYAEHKVSLAIAAGAVALLFQPFLKVTLGRTMWNVVDVVVAVALLLLCFKRKC